MKCAVALALFCALSLSLSAQAAYSSPTASPPEASAPLSRQLDELATRLEQALSDSATDWDLLSSILTELSSKLDRLAMSSRGLELESESMQASLKSFESSLEESMRLVRRGRVKLWAWRIGAGIAAGLAVWGWAR